jgi:hypothetical protein
MALVKCSDTAVIALGIVLSLMGIGCTKTRAAAAEATQEFRQRCARGELAKIYNESGPDFRASTTEADFTKFMTGVSRKLGVWQSSKSVGVGVNVGLGGRTVNLRYNSQFEKGPAAEEFRWRFEGERAILLGYNINSPVFVTN